jgi:hypothetical protein
MAGLNYLFIANIAAHRDGIDLDTALGLLKKFSDHVDGLGLDWCGFESYEEEGPYTNLIVDLKYPHGVFQETWSHVFSNEDVWECHLSEPNPDFEEVDDA